MDKYLKYIIKILYCSLILLFPMSILSSFATENTHREEANPTHISTDNKPQKIEEITPNLHHYFPCGASNIHSPPNQRDKTGQLAEKERSSDKGWWRKLLDDPIALFTALLFGATLALFWATYRLVTGAEVTAKHQLRAYVFVSLADGEKLFLDENECLSAPLIIKNFGQTPAYNLKCSVFIGPCKLPLSETLDPPQYTSGSIGCLAQNQVFRQYPTLLRKFSQIEMDGITSGEYGVYVWGYLEYSDIFKFTQKVQFRMVSTGGDFSRGELAYCNEGNEAT